MYKLNKEVIINKLGDTCVAYDNNSQLMHELNETGYLILEAFEKKKSKKEILNKLIKTYNIDKLTANNDFEIFVNLLVKKKLVSK